MKRSTVFYTVTLGIFWEAMYVIVIIGAGSLFALAIQSLAGISGPAAFGG